MAKKPIETVSALEAEQAAPSQTEMVEAAAPRQTSSILSEDEVAGIREKARKTFESERKAKARETLLDQEIQKLKDAEGGDEGGVENDLVNITLVLAPFQPDIRLDGRTYFNGHTYTVKRRVADTLREIVARGHTHQAKDIEGKKTRDMLARQQRSDTINARSGAVTRAA